MSWKLQDLTTRAHTYTEREREREREVVVGKRGRSGSVELGIEVC